MKLTITKLDAARRQLCTAVSLYFGGGDILSIHTLAFAAYGITRDLCDKIPNHPSSLTTILKQAIKPEYIKEIRTMFHEPGNYLKHADTDPGKTLDFEPDTADFFLFIAISQYESLTRDSCRLFRMFKLWMMKTYPKAALIPEAQKSILKNNLSTNPVTFAKQVQVIMDQLEFVK